MGKNCIYSFLILIGKCIIEIVECEIFSTNVQEIIAVSAEKIDFPAFPPGTQLHHHLPTFMVSTFN